jgi:hypothetical protein
MFAHIGIQGAAGEACVISASELYVRSADWRGFFRAAPHSSHSEIGICSLCVPKEKPAVGYGMQSVELIHPLTVKKLSKYGIQTSLSSKEYDACQKAVLAALRVLGLQGCRGK